MILDSCTDAAFIVRIAAKLLKYIHFIVPIILIAFIIYDLVKVVINGDEKSKKEAFSNIVKRAIYAIIVFLVPTLLVYALTKIDQISSKNDGYESATSWISCFNQYYH